jgi:hypothetical protein
MLQNVAPVHSGRFSVQLPGERSQMIYESRMAGTTGTRGVLVTITQDPASAGPQGQVAVRVNGLQTANDQLNYTTKSLLLSNPTTISMESLSTTRGTGSYQLTVIVQ